MITVRRDYKALDFARRNLIVPEDMVAVAQLVRQRIIERTARGVDASGQPFAPYSEGYAALKAEQLKSGGGVDLTVSGEMLRNITYEVKANGKAVSLFFAR